MTKFTWLGHSMFLIEVGDGPSILVDPWISDNPSYPEGFAFPGVDLLLITHGHFDHIGSAVEVAQQHDPMILCSFEVAGWLESKGVQGVTGMNLGGSLETQGVRVTMTQALHSSSIGEPDHPIYAGVAAGFVVRQPDARTFYCAGDTDVFGDMQLIRRLHKPSLAMLPIGDLYTMGPEGAAVACEFLSPQVVLPMHWGTFPALTGTPRQLRAALGPETTVVVPDLKPGDTYSW